ncbi:MAG TPA: hypothetical protein VFU02_12655 [Polyangiaceae bacterium]|nr:hypothetical protein [Polyangiaceae bacterium]
MPRPRRTSFALSWVAVCGVIAAACARAPESPAGFRVLEAEPEVLLERIAWLRQLPQLRPTRFALHDPEAFRELIESEGDEAELATSADHPAFQHAFGFAGAGKRVSDSLASVRRDEIVAFFDERTFTVHVREDAELTADASLSPIWVVAHEVGHSLQHQHFPIPDVARLTNEDERLAALAMLEGDAMLVMLAYAAYEQHAPLTRVIARVERAIQADEAGQYQSVSHSSEALSRAPVSVRERLVFPYLSGGLLMGSLYRAGGYPLVNSVYQSPPRTTEQVLHPEKYLSGELAVRVETPRLPAAYATLASGQMGELQLKALLRGCNRADAARVAAQGWGGDAFVIGKREQLGLLLWATTWDSELDAVEFERAMGVTTQCWNREFGPTAGATEVLRHGRHVAVVRGLAPAHAAPVLTYLNTLPGAPPSVTSRYTGVALRPPLPAPLREATRVSGSTVVAPYLALMLPIPEGFTADVREDVFLRARIGAGTVLLVVSEWLVRTDTNERLFSEFLTSFRTAAEIEPNDVVPASDGALATPLGTAHQRSWRVKGTTLHARLVVLSVCRGTGALVFAHTWSDPATLGQIDWVMANLRPLGPNVPPLCAELDP